jgi:hypothetical protein
VQPVGWLYALKWHASVNAFEGVVGNFQLDTDGQWFTILPDGKQITLNWDRRANVAAGLDVPRDKKQPTRVTGPVRLLLYMFDTQGVAIKVTGHFPDGPVAARWNGTAALVEQRTADLLLLHIPKPAVRIETNQLDLDLPVGTTLDKLEFSPRPN